MITFRKATASDLDAIEKIFDDVHTEEEKGNLTIGWERNVYPTRSTAELALEKGDLFVETADGLVVACARINSEEVPEYVHAKWNYEAPPQQISVLHTLCVSPYEAGKGYGSAFVRFYEEYSRDNGCPFLRMDTNERNRKARKMYAALGYTETGIVDCVFNGIQGVHLVCLEKTLN